MELVIKYKDEFFTAFYDEQYHELVSKYKWYIKVGRNTYYAKTNGYHGSLYLHQLIMSAQLGQRIDHKDGNGLNCQADNMRFCTRSQNAVNRHACGRSKYLGVSFVMSTSYHRGKKYSYSRWEANIGSGKGRHIGKFYTEEEAAKAYDKKAKELYGEFAKLNFPEENILKTGTD